jgi:hypothetical protein
MAVAASPETVPEQLPISPGPPPAESRPAAETPSVAETPQAAPRSPLRPLEAAQCSLCGIALPLGLLVPDGGEACDVIRWYCKDARSCTERWTTGAGRATTLRSG